MFELEKAINAWCNSVYPTGLQRQARIDELCDHLHCEVDRLVATGLSDEQAFDMATQGLGPQHELKRENTKDRSMPHYVLGVVGLLLSCNAKGLKETLSPKSADRWIIGVSLFFAGSMILASWMMGGSEQESTGTMLLMAVWWVPYSMLTAVSGSRECRRKVS